MVTDPWFLIEQSVNMYFEFFKLFSPPSYRLLSSSNRRKYKVNSLQRGFKTTYFIPNFSKIKHRKMLVNHNHEAL